MDELIVAFINSHYTDELKADIFTALELFNKFAYKLLLNISIVVNNKIFDLFLLILLL